MNAMPDLYPAIVKSYDATKRLVRVEIPGITDGGDVLPEAELCNPIGDKSEHTEIRILPGDRVWVSFANGDARYPVIMGYRPKQTGNEMNYRRWHHANIELDADQVLHLKAVNVVIDASSTVQVNCQTATVTAQSSVNISSPTTTVSGQLSVGGSLQVGGSASVAGDVTGAGISLTQHTHGGVTSGGDSTGPAQ